MIEAPPAIHYTVEGPGEGAPVAAGAVVLLNGGMMSGLAWEPIAKDLARDHRVIRLDFRGQLMSPTPPEQMPADLSGHARDVLAVLDRIGVEKADLVGTSFGALVGLAFAAEHPERTRSLVAMTATARLSPEMVAGTRAMRALARAALAGGDGGKVLDAIVPATYSPEWIAANQAMLTIRRAQVAALPRAWYEGLDGLLAALEVAEPFRTLDKIRCPTLVVAGEKDLTFPPPNSEELARAIAGARLEVIPGAPHGLALELPAATLERIRPFLASVGARSDTGSGSDSGKPGAAVEPAPPAGAR